MNGDFHLMVDGRLIEAYPDIDDAKAAAHDYLAGATTVCIDHFVLSGGPTR